MTLLDGKTVERAMSAGCGWAGFNDMGRFDFFVDRLRRIDFKR